MRFSKTLLIHVGAISLYLLGVVAWGSIFYSDVQPTIVNSAIGVFVCYFACLALLPKPRPAILKQKRYQVLAVVLGCYCIQIVLIAFLRIDYSRPILLSGFIFSFVWLAGYRLFQIRNMGLKLHSFSSVENSLFSDFESVHLIPTSKETLVTSIGLGVVSDFHKPLSDNDKRLLAECSLHDIPIYHADLLLERLSKTVETEKLNPISISLFNPNPIYLKAKQAIETSIVLLTIPMWLPVACILTFIIKVSDPKEPALFKQLRTGYQGKPFSMYKFRTMSSSEDEHESFATSQQHRVSKLGGWLRKTRLDEIPQFLNVLKGDMSLVGPRPEQPGLAEQFQQTIPFYGYRHSVKPGITGWAQTEQGYTDDEDSTSTKLSYDLYYIKNLNIHLDLYILIKTLNVVLLRKGI
ncbi:bacterial sugar transferase [Vibrio ishigakensis]|uniref:Bacterial sugar transferase n=1 Tax=Vibrio ishigakensis TaxID=1481914 RepID=A0A0B8PKZ0_9VIBR|nr:bacterial sugar transferase [Vibrio ishigakensis]